MKLTKILIVILVLSLVLMAAMAAMVLLRKPVPEQLATAMPGEEQPAEREETPVSATEIPAESTAEAPTQAPTEAPTQAPTEPEPRSFLLTFAGDFTLGCREKMMNTASAFPNVVGDDYSYPMKNVLQYFENDDCSFANLEGVLGDKGEAAKKTYVFRGKAEYVRVLTENSVETVTLANNHAYDYGEEGYAETRRILEEGNVRYTEHLKSITFTTDSGLTIGLYAVNFLEKDVQTEKILEDIRALKESGAELIICAFHWGKENTFRPQESQKELGHAVIDAGAHIVWGHHPHVLQPIEEYNGGIIYYSLGNFVFGGNSAPKDRDTALVQQEVIREADGTVRLGKMTAVPCSVGSEGLSNNFQPTPYEEGTNPYERVFRKLNNQYTGKNLAIG